MSKTKNITVDTIYLIVLFGWVGFYSYPFFFESLTHNYREIQTYNLDSMMMLKAVESALSARYFFYSFNDYGHFYPNLSMILCELYSWLFPLNEHAIFFILRLVSLLGGCATIAVAFLFARRFLGRLEAYFTAAVLVFTPPLITYSNEVKPDTWQAAFITLSLFFCALAVTPGRTRADTGKSESDNRHRKTLYYLYAAAAAAGAAFGTKYLGLLMLPLIAVAVATVPPISTPGPFSRLRLRRLPHLVPGLAAAFFVLVAIVATPHHLVSLFQNWHRLDAGRLRLVVGLVRYGSVAVALLYLAIALERAGTVKLGAFHRPLIIAERWLIVGFVFFFVFAVSSPWDARMMGFVSEFFYRAKNLSTGQHFGTKWLSYLLGFGRDEGNYVGQSISILGILGALFVPAGLVLRREFSVRYLQFSFVLGFAVIFVGLLIASVNRETILYGLPIIVPLVLLAAFAISEAKRVVTGWTGTPVANLAAGCLVIVLAGTQAWHGAQQLFKYPNLVTALTPQNQKLAGWLETCVPTDSKIMAASYSYVPPQFEDAIMADGYDNYKRFGPNLVIVNMKLVQSIEKTLANAPAAPGSQTADFGHLFRIVLRSGNWWSGPRFGKFATYATPALAERIKAKCQAQ